MYSKEELTTIPGLIWDTTVDKRQQNLDTLTTRGLREDEMQSVAEFLDRAMAAKDDANALKKIREEVAAFCAKFPMPH